ncbi:ROK family protein [Sphingobium sp.]|uniref:ROK family protein n=1 Tax=Sphingobium sp. TaxID=1912891 RepID=UPI002C4FE6C3|nr:ROK family protein [Sphingobium sp.]HUD89964.1 ROK family protein [Sphingobium sp.]
MRICADVGGSFVDIAMVDADASIHHRAKFPTPTRDWAGFVNIFRRFQSTHAAAMAPDDAICIAIAGLPEPENGRIISANIECIHGRALAQDMSAELGRPVFVINDADAFVLGEARLGAAKGHRRVMGIILGTGVGGGIIADGKVLTGSHGIGGEWGHGQVIFPSPKAPAASPLFQCGCGRTGCLDTIGSARGLERLHHFLHGTTATSKEITLGFAAGEALPSATVDYFTDIVAGILSVMLNTFPATIVPVGGGLSNSAELISAIDRKVRMGMLDAPASPILATTMLGGDAGLLGAYFAAE